MRRILAGLAVAAAATFVTAAPADAYWCQPDDGQGKCCKETQEELSRYGLGWLVSCLQDGGS